MAAQQVVTDAIEQMASKIASKAGKNILPNQKALDVGGMIDYIKKNGREELIKQLDDIAKPKPGRKGKIAPDLQEQYEKSIRGLYENAKTEHLTEAYKARKQRRIGESQIRGYRNTSELSGNDLTIKNDAVQRIQKDASNNVISDEAYRHRGGPGRINDNPSVPSDSGQMDGQMSLFDINPDMQPTPVSHTRETYAAARRQERISGRREPIPEKPSPKESSPFGDLKTDNDGQMSFDFGKESKPFTIDDTLKEVTVKNRETGQLETRRTTPEERQQELRARRQNVIDTAEQNNVHTSEIEDDLIRPATKSDQISGQDELVVNSATGDLTTKNERLETQQRVRDEQVRKDSRTIGQRAKDAVKGVATGVKETVTGNGDDASRRFRGRNKRNAEYEAAQERYRVTGEGQSQTRSEFRRNYEKPPVDNGDFTPLSEYGQSQKKDGIADWMKDHQLVVAGAIAGASIGGAMLINNSRDGD